MKYICKYCGVEKNVEEFRKNYSKGPYEPWNLRKCKGCAHDDYLERSSDLGSREALKNASRDWKSNNKSRHAEINNRWYQNNKHKARAGAKARYAIVTGNLTRLPCEVCGISDGVHAHHDSYENGKELEVRWLCKDHHKLWHVVLDSLAVKDDLDKRFIFFVQSLKI